jgi:hypothetical protein
MFNELSYDEKNRLMHECAEFLASPDRAVPKEARSKSNPMAGKLWLKWHKKEQKKIKRFALYFDKDYYLVRYRKNSSIYKELNLTPMPPCRKDAMMIMRHFLYLGSTLRHDARANFLLAKEVIGVRLIPELHLAAEDFGQLLIFIAETATDDTIRLCALNNIFDENILYDFSQRKDRKLKNLAKIRLWAYKSENDYREFDIRDDIAEALA